MKLTRRLCALLLAALLMLSAAGCSSEPSSTASDSPSESSSSQPEEFPSEPEESSSEAEELPSEAEPGSVPEPSADSDSSSQAAQPTLTFQGETVLEAAVLDYDLHFTADCPLTLLEPVMDDLMRPPKQMMTPAPGRSFSSPTPDGTMSGWERARRSTVYGRVPTTPRVRRTCTGIHT